MQRLVHWYPIIPVKNKLFYIQVMMQTFSVAYMLLNICCLSQVVMFVLAIVCFITDSWQVWVKWVIIDSGNGLLPSDNKPLPEPMIISHPLEHISMKFYKTIKCFHSWKCIWKWRLQNDGHVGSGFTLLNIHWWNVDAAYNTMLQEDLLWFIDSMPAVVSMVVFYLWLGGIGYWNNKEMMSVGW